MILYNNQMMEGHSVPQEDWQVAAYHAFAAKMMNREDKFPCIPATLGFSHSHLRYGFVPDPRSPYSEQTMAELLRNYTENSRQFGKYTSLILFFSTPSDLKNKFSVEQYESLFWDLLSRTGREDKREWPQHIPVDPANHVWEFNFHEESYFVYCATPAHTRRQSRHFPFFMLALTPRWVLVEFNKLPKQAQMMKPLIRQRLEAYDTIGPHPDLKLYGDADNYEWKQYFLRDNDTTAPSCPFSHGRLSRTRDHSSTN
ncbi:YqcI/YcgG family protein [compost metagenome]